MTRFRMSLLKQNVVVFVVFVLEKILVRTSRQYNFIGTCFFQLLHDFSNRSLLIFPNLKFSWLKLFLPMNNNIKTTSISWTFTQCLKITHCERSELRLHFEFIKNAKNGLFGEFLNTCSLRWNSVTRHVIQGQK